MHDHGSIYSEGVDRTIAAMGPIVLRNRIHLDPGRRGFRSRGVANVLDRFTREDDLAEVRVEVATY